LAAQERPTDLEAFSPRRAHLLHVAKETLVGKKSSTDATSIFSSTPPTPTTPAKVTKTQWPEPVRLLMQALGPYAPELKEDFFNRLVPYFRKTKVAKGQVLWQINDMADSFYVLETGILKAVYNFPNQLFDTSTPSAGKSSGCDNDLVNNHAVSESMLPGTIAGEMTFLAGIKRNTSVFAERDCILWKMSTKDLKLLEEKEGPGIARSFRQCILRVSVESADGKQLFVGFDILTTATD
jgi:SulP family sulfate permease